MQGEGGNVGVSTGDDGTLIVDDQYAPLPEKITATVRELTDKPTILAICNVAASQSRIVLLRKTNDRLTD